MQKYKITYDPDKATEDSFEGIYGISLVGEAANGFKFVALNNQKKIELKVGDKEKRLLISPVLIPGQEIYRDWDGGCTIEFDAQTIRLASQDFLKNGYNTNSKIDHAGDFVDGIAVVELWIVDNPEMDKAKHYGFDVPQNTLMAAMKVESDDLWNNYIKTGKVTGFSIDSFFGIEKIYESVKLQINNKIKTKENMNTNFFKFLSTSKTVKLAVDMLEIEVEGLGKLWAVSWEKGQVVYKEVEGAQVPAADAKFTFEGKEYTTDAEGKILDIVEVPTDVAVEMAKIIRAEFSKIRKELKLEDAVEEVKAIVEDRTDELVDVIEEAKQDAAVEDVQALKDRIAELEALINTMKTETEAVKAEVVELKKIPLATKATAVAVEKVTLNKQKMTRAEFFASIK